MLATLLAMVVTSAVNLVSWETPMTSSAAATLVLAILAAPPVLAAQPAVERIPDTVKTGLRVSIVDEQGRQIDGHVDGVSEDTVRLRTRRGGIQDIPVDRIVRIERPDSLRNGALIGLGVGVFNGILGGMLDPQGRSRRPGFVLVSTIGNTIICTALGTGIDAIFDNRRTLYQRGKRAQARLSPLLGRDVRGAALSWTW